MRNDDGRLWRTAALILVAVLGIGVVYSLFASGPEDERAPPRASLSGPAPPCPFGYVDHLGRGELLLSMLRSTEEGVEVLEQLGTTEVRFCFGDIDVPVVAEDRLLLLTRGEEDDVLAARVGHLLLHVVRGPPLPTEIEAGADCDALVRRALQAEAAAYAAELRLRRELEVEAQRYEFEQAFWEHGERAIFEYLVAHPEGGPGLDPLGSAYRQRCEIEAGR